ncbi:hypothetical protein SUGI_0885100 [Cryptomeria japonica]|nr:hypothetical protein SUGI_0885100 [Cryptomeria japonica]
MTSQLRLYRQTLYTCFAKAAVAAAAGTPNVWTIVPILRLFSPQFNRQRHNRDETEFSEKEKIPKGYQIPDIFDSKWRQGRPLEREDNVKRGLGHLERVAEQGNDQPTALNSNLGRIDYAHGLAALLLNHYIKVALVAGIFEFWGMGKSSIMIQDMVGNKFLALNMEEEAEVNNDLSASTSKKVSVMHKVEDIRYLLPRAWLNDEVNLYLELLKERAKIGCTQFLKCHFFNAFFYTKL